MSSAGRSAVRGLLAALALALPAAAAPAPGPVVDFKVGLARSSLPNVNRNDALAAYRAFLDTAGRRRGRTLQTQARLFDDNAAFATALRRDELHLAVMDAWQFLSLDVAPYAQPAYVPTIDGEVGRRFVVVARRGAARTVSDLHHQPVLLLAAADNQVCRAWLASLLPPAAGRPEDYFTPLEIAAKPTAAVLPVYFGRRAACIIDERSFTLMQELNPQVGQDLAIVARSERFIEFIVCVGERGWLQPSDRTDLLEALGELGAEPAGQQILTLFRISGLVPFEDRYLDSVRRLRPPGATAAAATTAEGQP